MINLKKITLLFAGLASASQAFAYWEYANLQEDIPSNGVFHTCVYESPTGYRFSIQKRGSCSYTVEFDPETGRVKR